jgi:acylglycerol lipase
MVEMESIRIRYADLYEAHARLWVPQEPRGAVLYLHGIQSHGLWFESSAQRLAEAGYVVLLPDRRGSGRNDAERGHTPSAWRLLRDAAEGMDELHIRTGLTRFHVAGVSWGGKLALALHRYLPTRVASLALIAPGLFPKVDIPLTQKIRVGWSAIANRHAAFDIPLNDPEMFTANPARQAFIREDKLALRQVTAAFLLASRKLDRYAQKAESRNAETPKEDVETSKSRNLETGKEADDEAQRRGPRDAKGTPGGEDVPGGGCPLMVFLGGLDRIIDNTRTKEFVRGLPWPKREITEYPDAHHTLEFEARPEQFLDDLLGWVGEVSGFRSPACAGSVNGSRNGGVGTGQTRQ